MDDEDVKSRGAAAKDVRRGCHENLARPNESRRARLWFKLQSLPANSETLRL